MNQHISANDDWGEIFEKLEQGMGWPKANQKIVFTEMLPFVKENPGILQKDMYKEFPKGDDRVNGPWSIMYWLGKMGIISREKQGGSLALSLKVELDKEVISRQIDKWLDERGGDPRKKEYIRAECYPDSKKRIIGYFGEEFIKKAWQIHWDSIQPNIRMAPRSKELMKSLKISPKVIKESQREHYYDDFLSRIGSSIDLEMNEPLQEVIDKYWTDECTTELKKFLSQYGFSSDEHFVRTKVREIIGEKRWDDFFNELNKKSSTFSITFCGYTWVNIKSYHLPYIYAASLKFKWGIKP